MIKRYRHDREALGIPRHRRALATESDPISIAIEMPYHTDFKKSDRLGVVVFSGSVSGAELCAAIVSVSESVNRASGFRTIWDFRAVRQFVFSAEDLVSIWNLIYTLGAAVKTSETAIVVSKDIDPGLIANLSGRLRESTTSERVFHSAKDAFAWLGIEHAAMIKEGLQTANEVEGRES